MKEPSIVFSWDGWGHKVMALDTGIRPGPLKSQTFWFEGDVVGIVPKPSVVKKNVQIFIYG